MAELDAKRHATDKTKMLNLGPGAPTFSNLNGPLYVTCLFADNGLLELMNIGSIGPNLSHYYFSPLSVVLLSPVTVIVILVVRRKRGFFLIFLLLTL